MLVQQTIKSVISAVGVGLHSGQRVDVTLRPAKPDTGIVFRRIDLLEPVSIQTSAMAVTDTRLASTISSTGVKVQTVEHLMSACAGLGIDNLLVDINGEEVPILDGSSSSFVFLLQSAGIEKQKALKKFIRVLQPVVISEGEGEHLKWAKFEPYNGYKLNFQIDFAHVAVNATGQEYEFDLVRNSYARDISRARTFCFTKDVEMMRARQAFFADLNQHAAHHAAQRVVDEGVVLETVVHLLVGKLSRSIGPPSSPTLPNRSHQ